MSTTHSDEHDIQAGAAPAGPPRRGRILRVVLLGVIALAVVAAATAIGWNRGHAGAQSAPGLNSVDAGFALDMSTHHQQAVTMAIYERANTSDPDLKLLAYDIEDTQVFQEGQMQGWLDNWGLSRSTPRTQMSWMAGHGHLQSDGLMPGMATAAQMSQLESAKGKALDVLFLQLMIRHHQGGLSMAQYAVMHSTKSYVRTMAQSIYTAQSDEIVQMEQLLRGLGGSPLPPPSTG